jgi:hypothetical protein
MILDEGLIQEVQMKATGANIHKVISKITAYKYCIEALESIYEEDTRNRIIIIAKRAEKALRVFIVTGRLE